MFRSKVGHFASLSPDQSLIAKWQRTNLVTDEPSCSCCEYLTENLIEQTPILILWQTRHPPNF